MKKTLSINEPAQNPELLIAPKAIEGECKLDPTKLLTQEILRVFFAPNINIETLPEDSLIRKVRASSSNGRFKIRLNLQTSSSSSQMTSALTITQINNFYDEEFKRNLIRLCPENFESKNFGIVPPSPRGSIDVDQTLNNYFIRNRDITLFESIFSEFNKRSVKRPVQYPCPFSTCNKTPTVNRQDIVDHVSKHLKIVETIIVVVDYSDKNNINISSIACINSVADRKEKVEFRGESDFTLVIDMNGNLSGRKKTTRPLSPEPIFYPVRKPQQRSQQFPQVTEHVSNSSNEKNAESLRVEVILSDTYKKYQTIIEPFLQHSLKKYKELIELAQQVATAHLSLTDEKKCLVLLTNFERLLLTGGLDENKLGALCMELKLLELRVGALSAQMTENTIRRAFWDLCGHTISLAPVSSRDKTPT